MPHTDGTPDRIVHNDTATSSNGGGASESLASEHDEDSQHLSGDKGIQVLAVRADAAGSLVDTDGDYAPFQVDSSGALRVTTAGAGPAASVSIIDSGADELDVNADGSIDVNVQNFPATQPVSGTVTADTELPAAAALADNTANPTVPGVGAFGMVYDGSTWDRAPGNSTDGTLVNLGANNDVAVSSLPSGTFANGAETAVAGTPVEILASNASRKHAIVQNVGAANIRVGIAGVAATTGHRLIPGQIESLPVTSAIYAIREGSVSSTAFAQEIT